MNKAKMAVCWHCQTILPLELGRSSACMECQRDARVCLNCRFYDSHSYNECHESQAERIVDKEKGNFCDYFSTVNTVSSNPSRGKKRKTHSGSSKSEALRAAEALFK
jgi:hypothetical protein